MQTSTGAPAGLEQNAVSERGGGISSPWKQGPPYPHWNIPEPDYPGASTNTGAQQGSTAGSQIVSLLRAVCPQDRSTANYPIATISAREQNRNSITTTKIQSPGNSTHISPVSNLAAWTTVAKGEGDTQISSWSTIQDITGKPCMSDSNYKFSDEIPKWRERRRAWGVEGDLGSPAGAADWGQAPDSEKTPPQKKRRGTVGKTSRWTQRIKERWRDKHTGLGKSRKGKRSEEDGENEKKSKGDEGEEELQQLSQPTQHPNIDKTVGDIPTLEEESTFQSPVREQLNKATPTEAEGSSTGRHMSTGSDFEFSLSPTNLMEEIFTGKEWSNFLPVRGNPSPMEATSESVMGGHSWTPPIQRNDGPEKTNSHVAPTELWASTGSQWSFSPGVTKPNMDRATMQISVGPTPNEDSNKHMLIQSSANADGWRGLQEYYQAQDIDQTQQNAPETPAEFFPKPLEVLDNSALMSRVHLNRKRDHSSTSRRPRQPMRWGEGEGVEPGQVDTTVNTSFETIEGAKESDVSTIPLYVLKDPPPLSSPSALRSSMMHDSESAISDETVIKKRKMKDAAEDSRRVRFAEEPVFLPDVLPFEYASTENSEPSSLPGWILTLKKKTRWKPKQ
ncbi:hypothetical protein AGOR_G00182630 [Albula goreensis]|uniref:Uncharacterized protein n=1 Tax=Albula goreensis TaxID=1534307 RepID=A0A8T3CV42_9TELE|nr:hypothetical protein AGOR_G00182630 [Albula goreensis]